jgi:hypothetical protein
LSHFLLSCVFLSASIYWKTIFNSNTKTNVLGWNRDPFYPHVLFQHGVISH